MKNNNQSSITISPSQVPAIMSGDFARVSDLFLIKTGCYTKKQIETGPIYWGKKLQSLVVDETIELVEKGLPRLKQLKQIHEQKVFHQKLNWFYGYVDCLTFFESINDCYIIEAKTTAKPMTANNINQVHADYYLQVQAYLMMAAALQERGVLTPSYAYLAILSQGSNFSVVKIDPDFELQSKILEAVTSFADACEANDLELFPIYNFSYQSNFSYIEGTSRVATRDEFNIIKNARELQTKINCMKRNLKVLTDNIRLFTADKEALTNEQGALLVINQWQANGKRKMVIR